MPPSHYQIAVSLQNLTNLLFIRTYIQTNKAVKLKSEISILFKKKKKIPQRIRGASSVMKRGTGISELCNILKL